MLNTHQSLVDAFAAYLEENEKFTSKGVKVSAARARKALQDIGNAVKLRRKEISEEKEALTK
jgi:hypothetical protein